MLSCRTGFMAWLRRVLCAAAVFSQVACSLPTEGTGASTADVDGGTTGGSGGGQAGGGSGGTGATGGVGGTTTHCAAPMSCIPSPPSGWVGYVRMRGEGYPPADVMGPVCPDESTPERYYSGLAGPAQCAPCSCSNQKGGKCGTAPLFCSKSSTDCSGAQDATGDVDGCGITNGHSGLSTLSCFIGTIPVVSAGTCDPSPADFSNKDPWTGVNDVCVVVGTDGCGENERCIPPGSGEYAGYVCIQSPGDVECPPDWGARTLVYKSVQDDRNCSQCVCTPDAANCVDAKYEIHDWLGCLTGGKTVSSSTCVDLSSTVNAGWYAERTQDPFATGTCTPSGGQPTGGISGQGAITFCCRN